MHMVNNITAFAAYYLLPQSIDNRVGYIIFTFLGIVLLVVSLSFFNKNILAIEETNKVAMM